MVMSLPSKPKRTLRRAVDLERSITISSDELLGLNEDQYNKIRRAAAYARAREMVRFACEKCGFPVYSPRDRWTKLPLWQHYSGAPSGCEWFSGAPASVDSISASQFNGQQESPLHENLKTRIAELLSYDTGVDPSSIVVDKYLIGHDGRRKPDIRCSYNHKPLAIELQLSSTQLPIIVGREMFYADNGHYIIWITWNFEEVPFSQIRQAFKDIFYSHNKNLFSIDGDTIEKSRLAGKFLLRALWLHENRWQTKIISLDELTWPLSGLPYYKEPELPWHIEMRHKWLGMTSGYIEKENLLNSIAARLGISVEPDYGELRLVDLIDLLISLNERRPIASGQANLLELLNTFFSSAARHRFANIVRNALEVTGNKELLDVASLAKKHERATQAQQDGRRSIAGQIAIALFPEWFLPP